MGTAPLHPESYNSRYVEYVDAFSRQNVFPSAAVLNSLLLFDNLEGTDPLANLYQSKENKMYQQLFIYVVGGTYVISINGKEETLTGGQCITVMPENITKTKHRSSDFRYFAVVLYPKLSTQVYSSIGITYSNARMSLCHFTATLTDEQMQRMYNFYETLKKEILGMNYNYRELYIRELLAAFMVENINLFGYSPLPLEGDSNSRQYDIYCRFLTLLNKHSIEHRSVQFYAKLLDITSKYLSFVCVSYSKKNASTWIDESVVQKAKALMLVHHYSFTQTSETLHFPTVSSFSRFFKRVTGTTPKEFLRS